MNCPEFESTPQQVRWPSPAWRSAFRDQATSELLQTATRCASMETARLRYHHPESELIAEDLVQTVLASTWDGTLTWRPEAVSLRIHVQDGIRHACRHALHRYRARRGPDLIALDTLNDDGPYATEVEEALVAEASETNHETARLAHRLMQELRLLAAGDRDALAVLAALEQGVSGNLELAEVTDLNLRAIDSARKRLQRLGRRVSLPLLADIKSSRGQSPDCDVSNVLHNAAKPRWSASGSSATSVSCRAIKDFKRANERRGLAH